MTIVVALRQDRQTLCGYSDGCRVYDTPVYGTFCPWVFFGEWALGITGESAVQAIVQESLDALSSHKEPHILLRKLRELLMSAYIGAKEDGEMFIAYGVHCILVHRDGRIWNVHSCLSLKQIPEGKLWSQGSGSDYAIGADYAGRKLNPSLSATERVRIAIEAAVENDIHCIGTPKIQAF